MRKNRILAALMAGTFLVGCTQQPDNSAPAASPEAGTEAKVSDADISDAYLYLLSRLLVLRQQQLDVNEPGFKWNEIIHRDVGGVDWANPNLDVAYSEAWVAVDDKTCTVITVPQIKDLYYTVQFLNGWGETVGNINERNYPEHPWGDFAMCLKGATVTLPEGVERIDLPGRTSRVLARVELGDDADAAVALQRQIAMRTTGAPVIEPVPVTPPFENTKLPGVEAFDSAVLALDSEADINPGMDVQQAKVRAVVAAIADPAERERVEKVIREQALPKFVQFFSTAGTQKNGWSRPSVIGKYGDDFMTRTFINYGGIWANSTDEVVYFKTNIDGAGEKLDGGRVYTATFPGDSLPASHVQYFWSVIAVDPDKLRVIPNAKDRFLINAQSELEYGSDGSLTLYFAPELPQGAPDGNWLPTPVGSNYNLTYRAYGADQTVLSGDWFPAPLVKQGTDQ